MASISEILEFLDREGALSLGDVPDVWPTLGEGEEVYEVDWSRLFPRRPLDQGPNDWDLYGSQEWELDGDDLVRIFGAGRSDEPHESNDSPESTPGWDRCAWYQPIHFHGPAWGIYLYDECLVTVARGVYALLGAPPMTIQLAQALLRAAFASLFLHEQYHHKIESLGLRLHVVQQRSLYPGYFKNVYMNALGTDDLIEEGLANADSFRRLDTDPYRTWLPGRVGAALRDYLRAAFQVAPPGYRLATNLLDDVSFGATESLLSSQLQEGTVTPARPTTPDWLLATHLTQSMFSVRQNIWTIVAKGSKPLLPVRPRWIAPLERRKVEKVLKREGFKLVPGRGKGSHGVYRHEDRGIVVLPSRKELTPGVAKTTAHTLGLKNAAELERLASRI